MIQLIKNFFFRKKIDVDGIGLRIVPLYQDDTDNDLYCVMDGDKNVSEGTKAECELFIEAITKILKKFG